MGTQVKVGEQQFSETVTIAGQDLFKVFDFEILAGSSDALRDAGGVVINNTIARTYFGDGDPIGKQISIQIGENFEEFVIKAVINKIPTNSSIRFYLCISDLNYPRMYSAKTITSEWFNITPETYLLLRQGVNKEDLVKKFPPVFKLLLGEEDFKNSHFPAGPSNLAKVAGP